MATTENLLPSTMFVVSHLPNVFFDVFLCVRESCKAKAKADSIKVDTTFFDQHFTHPNISIRLQQ
jgi:hypothetical protein